MLYSPTCIAIRLSTTFPTAPKALSSFLAKTSWLGLLAYFIHSWVIDSTESDFSLSIEDGGGKENAVRPFVLPLAVPRKPPAIGTCKWSTRYLQQSMQGKQPSSQIPSKTPYGLSRFCARAVNALSGLQSTLKFSRVHSAQAREWEKEFIEVADCCGNFIIHLRWMTVN